MRFSRVAAVGAIFITVLQGQKPVKSGIDQSAIDKACKPCDDFWRYANGAWLDKNPIPANRPSWGIPAVLRNANTERLRTILETAQGSSAAKGSKERMIGDLYASCMDTKAIDALGLDPIREELKEVEGIRTRADVAALIVKFQLYGGLDGSGVAGIGPFAVFAGPDLKDATQVVPRLYPDGLSMPDRDYYLRGDEKSKQIREEFGTHIARTMMLAGATEGDGRLAAETVIRMETSIAKSSRTNVERRNPELTNNKMDWAAVAELAPAIDWNALVEGLKIPKGIAVIVAEPNSLKEVQNLLTGAAPGDWKTWLRWRVLRRASGGLSAAFREESFRFNQTVLQGIRSQLPRWETCVANVDLALGDALGELFVRKHFAPAAKQRMNAMVENLRETLREEIENAAWLSAETRKNAIAKLEAFRAKIGHPERWRDYSNVVISKDTYLANLRSAAMAARSYNLGKIGKPVDRGEFNMSAPTVNAYYSPVMNEIVFPAGILQPPMFDAEADDASNYGGIGAVIGHEMGHGFDDQGSKFAADGSLRNWWTAEDRKQFEARAQCVVDQFNTLDVGEGLHHNGSLVVGEALGDLGGLTLAYHAYQRSLKGKPGPVMDGLTADQRFFLAFARSWATNLRPEALRLQLNTNPHPVAKFRANGTLQNMPEFHKAFGCKLGDFMVRAAERQCRLW